MAEYQKGGDYILKEMTLTNFRGDSTSIESLFISLSYKESIFHSTVFGEIQLSDAVDLVQYFPIIGQEKLHLRFATYEGAPTVDKEFFVYSISPKTDASRQASNYTLYFTSKETLVDQNTRISKSYRAKSCGEIVKSIFSELASDKSLSVGDTIGRHNIVVPNWNPIESINWTRTFAHSANHPLSCFLFYENANGFNYQHVQDLIEKDAVSDAAPYLSNLAEQQGNDGQIRPGNTIMDARVIKAADTLMNISQGMFATRTISYDNVAKTIRTQDHKYADSFGQNKHMSDFPLVTNEFGYNSVGQHINVIPSTSHRDGSGYFAQNEGASFSRKTEDVAVGRASLHSQISTNQIAISMYGDTALTAGITMNITLNNHTAVKDKANRVGDKLLSDKMLVAECVHVMNRNEHRMEMIFFKDSYNNQPEHDYS